MATRLVHIVVDAADPSAQARFWAAALDWEVAADDPDEAVVWPPGFDYPAPEALPLVFVPVPEPKGVKNRVHLDLASTSVDQQRALVARLTGLGARPVDIGQGLSGSSRGSSPGQHVPWVVLADPEGNEFCVLEPRPVYADAMPVAAVVVDSADPEKLAGFWVQAAGWSRCADRRDIVALRSPAGIGPFLEFLPSSDQRSAKNRLHLDVAPRASEEHAEAVRSLRQAGAMPADVGQGQVPWEVLADPEGNEFCVLTPR